MASEKDFELLDQYVGNRLNAEEKASFEKKLEADGELKNEYKLQQQIVDGLRKKRTLELKTMLNDVPLSAIPGEGPSILVKISLWVLVAGLVGTGLYFYINEESPVEQSITEAVIKETPAEETVSTEPEVKDETPAEKAPEVTPKVKENTSELSSPKAPEQTDEKAVTPSTLDVFDPSEEPDASSTVKTGDEKAKSASAPSIIVETQVDKKYTFHYQFRDDKLYLYGSFEKNLYEIMEFFSDNRRTMFLFYKDNYYLLNEENEKVRALSAIHDEALLKKLKDYRGN